MAGALFDITDREVSGKMAEQNPNGLVIHISSLNDRSTEVVMQDRISIGASEDCDVKIRMAEGAGANGPVIELARLNGVYRITSLDSSVEVKLNSRPVKSNKAINDGDEIWIGPSGPSIQGGRCQRTAARSHRPRRGRDRGRDRRTGCRPLPAGGRAGSGP